MKIEWVFKKKYEQNLFPKTLGHYVFVKEIEKPFKSNNYFHAVYKSRDGKYFFAKLCKKKFGYEHYAFKNEISVYRVLYKSYRQALKSIPINLVHIKIPKFIGSYENNKTLIYLSEFVGGQPVKFKGEEGFYTYQDLLNFLTIIDKYITPKDRKMIPRRTSIQVLLIYSYVLLKAMLENPPKTLTLLVGAYHFTCSISHFLRNDTVSFVHRDLHAGNVIRNKAGIYIVDFQLSVLTNRIHEYTHTLRVEFDKAFTSKMIESVQSSSDIKLFRSSVIYSMTHALSARKIPKNSAVNWNNFLTQAVRQDLL